MAFDCCCKKYHTENGPRVLPKRKSSALGMPMVLERVSLFCVALAMPVGYELDLLLAQRADERGMGIFSCDEWAVYTNRTETLTPDNSTRSFRTTLLQGDLDAPIGGDYNTSMNTDVFIRFWQTVIADGRAWKHNWIVKVDPDALFFAARLRKLLRSNVGKLGGPEPEKGWYLNNCHGGLHGPIEVFSVRALKTYNESAEALCIGGPPHQHGQEDWFLRSCFRALEVEQVDAFNLLFEGHWACQERPSTWHPYRPPCFAPQVAFHPFKSFASLKHCYDEAIRHPLLEESLAPITEVPSRANERHG